MCTVTFVSQNGKTVITSNRDEQRQRQAAEPRSYDLNGKKVIYPRDPLAGGTWFALDENGTVAVLLNGAAEKHRHSPPYRRSRGLILLDIIGANSPRLEWESIDLENIEPFTLILFTDGELFQMRWNGSDKECAKLHPDERHIWSSSTLYPAPIRKMRKEWFAQFLSENPSPDEKALFHFHRHTHEDDKQDGLVIERGSFLKTISITQAIIDNGSASLSHHDLIAENRFAGSFQIA